MKENEAPEKLYVELCSDGVYAHVREWENSDNIEYTRTDAFIERVINFLNRKLDDVVATRVFGTIIPHLVAKQELIEDFKNYMKGE